MPINNDEIKRINRLFNIERNFHKKGYKLIAGVDEAGRGPLAGPVVAGAVILEVNTKIPNLKDSKLLSEKRRDEVYKNICKHATAYAYEIISEDYIDENNILNATLAAMKGAVEKLPIKPNLVLVDAMEIPNLNIPQKPIIKGDKKSACIAAASILAKVTRDNLMRRYDEIYPYYGFSKNKGYPTKEHISSIKRYGLCPIHRRSFKVKGLEL